MNFISIAIGGALGAVLRYFIGKHISFQEFPVATLFINTIGSLFLGYLFAKYAVSHPKLFLFFGIGFCGAFTTFSTFSLETYKLLIDAQYADAAFYILATLVLGIFATVLGVYLGKL